jgi:hypothetical protein
MSVYKDYLGKYQFKTMKVDDLFILPYLANGTGDQLLGIDLNGNAKTLSTGIDTNFSNTNLAFTADRTHNIGGHVLNLNNGDIAFNYSSGANANSLQFGLLGTTLDLSHNTDHAGFVLDNVSLPTAKMYAGTYYFLADKNGAYISGLQDSGVLTDKLVTTDIVTGKLGYKDAPTPFTTANARSAVSLTTTGSSGLATYNNTTGVLNIPNYTNTATVTSVNASIGSSALSISGGPITGSGTLAFAWTGTSSQQVLGDGSLVNKITNNNQLTNGAGYITSYTETDPIFVSSFVHGITSLGAGLNLSSGVLSSTITQYTNALARAAISLTTTGTSGAATYNNTTGALNIPNYTTGGGGGETLQQTLVLGNQIDTTVTAGKVIFKYNTNTIMSFQEDDACGSIFINNASGVEAISLTGLNGAIRANSLVGTGSRMVVADATGLMSAATIPSYSGANFILNQTSQQASSNFNISGTGVIGGLLKASDGLSSAPSITFSSNTAVGLFLDVTNSELKAVANNTGANFALQNLNSGGYTGIEYLDNTGATKVFSGYENFAGNFRFNLLGTGALKFKINSTDALAVNNDLSIGTAYSGIGNRIAHFSSDGTFQRGSLDPANVIQQSNVSTGLVYASGLKSKIYVLNVNSTDVGNVGGGEDDLMTFLVPAGLLANDGDSIWFETEFTTSENANSKELKLYFGSDVIYDASSLSAAGGSMVVMGRIIRTGAATQKIMFSVTSLNDPDTSSFSSATQTLSSAIVFKATGTAVADNDIVQKLMFIRYEGV